MLLRRPHPRRISRSSQTTSADYSLHILVKTTSLLTSQSSCMRKMFTRGYCLHQICVKLAILSRSSYCHQCSSVYATFVALCELISRKLLQLLQLKLLLEFPKLKKKDFSLAFDLNRPFARPGHMVQN